MNSYASDAEHPQRRWGAVGLVLGSAFSLQFGAALAASLFSRAGPLGVVALRLGFSALLLLAVCRPAVRGYRRADWISVVGLGLALGAMNSLIYQAIERIPLGAAVTLELLGPLVLSVVTVRRWSGLLWAVTALAGVVLLSRGGLGGGLDPVGAAYALGAGTMWVAYILYNARVGARFPRADGLALAMAVAACLSVPLGLATAGGRLWDPVVLALGAAVAVLSSGVPYTLEMLALRRLSPGTFAVLMSLMPAVAALAGLLVLGQRLGPPELFGIGLVILASAGAVRASRPIPPAA
ncbi:EamA family transporter [Streptomyces sp. NPDC005438]|uniref:EamA family transporter n=1 Tax=Streptomyces sp. NPDC005438 TaxID=3156880 RepID=UPI0033A8E0EC